MDQVYYFSLVLAEIEALHYHELSQCYLVEFDLINSLLHGETFIRPLNLFKGLLFNRNKFIVVILTIKLYKVNIINFQKAKSSYAMQHLVESLVVFYFSLWSRAKVDDVHSGFRQAHELHIFIKH